MFNKKTLTYEQAIELIDQHARVAIREELKAAQTQAAGKVTGVMSAVVALSNAASVDGRLTVADIIVSGALSAGFVLCGVPAGISAQILKLAPFDAVWAAFALTGTLAGGARLLLDQFDPLGNVAWIVEHWRFREDYADFKEWRQAQEYEERVTHSARVAVVDGPNTVHYLGLEGDELERVVEFACAYLAMDTPTTAESAWIGGGKMFSSSISGRAKWGEVKSFFLDHPRPRLAELVDERGKWEFTRTGLEVLREFARLELE